MNKKLKTMNTELLNALKDKAHTWAVGHGFYDEVKSDAFYLGLVMSEAGEAINADRKDPLHRYCDTRWQAWTLLEGHEFPISIESYNRYRLPYEMSFQPLIRFHKRGRPRKGAANDAASVKLPTQQSGDAQEQSED